MSLAIGRLVTRASVPRRQSSLAPAIDRVARGVLGRAFSEALASMRSANGSVWRIRRLRIQVRVPARGLTDELLARRWAEAFSRSVRAAIDRTDRHVEVVLGETRATWLASYLARRLSGDAPVGWAYDEFETTNSSPPGEAAVGLLEEHPRHALEILTILDGKHALDRLLAVMNDGQCDRLCGVIDRSERTTRGWSIGDLSAIGRMLLDRAVRWHDTRALATRARAIALFIEERKSSTAARSRHSISDILAMLEVFERLAAVRRVMDATDFPRALTHLLPRLQSMTPTVLREAIALGAAVKGRLPIEDPAGSNFVALIDELLVAVPSSGGSMARDLADRWIESDAAGLFLLVPIVQRLGWPERIKMSRLWGEHGPNALTYLLAGVGLAVVGTRLDNVERLDAGLSVFAGWMDEPNVGALRRFLTVTPADMRQNLLHVLLEDAGATTPPGQEASSWASVCDRLAAHVVRAFATRIRGFRQSSREFMVRSFLHAPGRVSVESDRVKVVLSRNPFWVAVHLSDADTRVERVSWLGDRSLEFELEGL